MTTESKTSMQKIEIMRNPKKSDGLVVIVRHKGQQANIVLNTANSWGHLEQMIGCAAQGMKTDYEEMVNAFHAEYNRLQKANRQLRIDGQIQDERIRHLWNMGNTLTFDEIEKVKNESL